MDALNAAVKAAELVLGRWHASRRRVIDYLATVSDEAARIVATWREIEQVLPGDDDVATAQRIRRLEVEMRTRFGGQAVIHSTLDTFYRQLTSVVGKSTPEEYRHGFLLHLSKLLSLRRDARAAAEAALSDAWRPVLLSSLDRSKPLRSLPATIDALDAEVAALRAIVTALRVTQ